jgi:integrase/recombinase XerD
MIKTASTKIVLINSKKLNGTYPIKLRVTYDRVCKLYLCNVDLTKEDFNKVIFGQKPRKSEKDIRDLLQGIEMKAKDIIKELKTFDFESFENKLYERKTGDGDLFDLFKKKYDELYQADQVGSAIMYNTVKNSLKSFRSSLSFTDIDAAFLKAYERWMLDDKKSITTVGIYMRHLRCIFNLAISEGLASPENYPFKSKLYVIPTGNNIKKALTIQEIGMIYNYKTASTGWERKAKDFWCFSYLANGMNVMDIAKLKYKDIQNGEIHYERSKTKRTNRGKSTNLISIPILPETQSIINTWGNKDKRLDNYIFPIISEGMTSLEVKKHVQQFTKNMNDYTKKIGISLGIGINITTYVARHSFATVLKRSGTPIEAISENLGHKNIATTKSYLANFESESRFKTAQALLAFESESTPTNQV